MKFYIEVFPKDDEAFDGYLETNLTPEQVANLYDEHPVATFAVTPEIANHFRLDQLDFKANDYFLTAAREYTNERYEYQGEERYPPPLFLPDSLNTDPARPNGRSP